MSENKPKPPLKDRVLDRIPLFGTVRRTKGWVRRHKGLVYLILGIVVIFIVRPVLSIIAVIFQTLKPFIDVLINNPVGRFIFYNVLGFILLWIVWRQVRAGVRRVFGMFAMRRFLDGVNLMLLRRWDQAVPHFEKVLRIGKRFRLEDAVPEHRDILADARLKIAYCHLQCGRSNDALLWLKVVNAKAILTDHVRRNHTELCALAYDLSDELEEETILKELEKSEGKDRRNRRILLALRARHEEAGDLGRARAVARRLVSVTEGREKEVAERDLALLEFRLAHKALGEGDRKSMMKALKATAGDTRSALRLGDLALEEGNVPAALKAWSRAVSLPVFDRLASLLASGRLAGDKERDLLLRLFPYAGTLLILAEYHHKKREYRKARAALDRVLETAGENITVLRLYAACLEGEGHTEEAAQLYRRALSQSFS